MMNEYLKQAVDFLKKANAICKIKFVGLAVNVNWNETQPRNLYEITLTTPRGEMIFDFWDCIHNTEISKMTLEEYVVKRWKCDLKSLKYNEKIIASKELKVKKEAAKPNCYDVLACLTKYDPGTFENFCYEYGYDEDSRNAVRIYFAVQKEYSQLVQIFTPEQLEEMQKIE